MHTLCAWPLPHTCITLPRFHSFCCIPAYATWTDIDSLSLSPLFRTLSPTVARISLCYSICNMLMTDFLIHFNSFAVLFRWNLQFYREQFQSVLILINVFCCFYCSCGEVVMIFLSQKKCNIFFSQFLLSVKIFQRWKGQKLCNILISSWSSIEFHWNSI